MSDQTSQSFASGRWTNYPVEVREDGTDLFVPAAEGSDAWRHTPYGFARENEPALLAPVAPGSAVEVEFTAAFSQQFDQAGVFVSAGRERWVKAGLEYVDGQLQLGAVVTNSKSDWSAAPYPEWVNQRVIVRVSWTGESL